jgi:hypothetical protein
MPSDHAIAARAHHPSGMSTLPFAAELLELI